MLRIFPSFLEQLPISLFPLPPWQHHLSSMQFVKPWFCCAPQYIRWSSAKYCYMQESDESHSKNACLEQGNRGLLLTHHAAGRNAAEPREASTDEEILGRSDNALFPIILDSTHKPRPPSSYAQQSSSSRVLRKESFFLRLPAEAKPFL